MPPKATSSTPSSTKASSSATPQAVKSKQTSSAASSAASSAQSKAPAQAFKDIIPSHLKNVNADMSIKNIITPDHPKIKQLHEKFVKVLHGWMMALAVAFPKCSVTADYCKKLRSLMRIRSQHHVAVDEWTKHTAEHRKEIKEHNIEELLALEIDFLVEIEFREKYASMQQRCPKNIEVCWKFIDKLIELSEELDSLDATIPSEMMGKMMDSAEQAYEETGGEMTEDDFYNLDLMQMGTEIVESSNPEDVKKMMKQLPKFQQMTKTLDMPVQFPGGLKQAMNTNAEDLDVDGLQL